MTTTLTRPPETKLGTEARRLRLSLHISRRALADLVGITPAVVGLFERNYPIPLDYRRRIHKALWSEKTKK
jgi:transcriptional regulator with XRE-family HTH domain